MNASEMWHHLSSYLNVNDYPYGAPTALGLETYRRMVVYLPKGEIILEQGKTYIGNEFDEFL